jgi:drug/metabolite transporter (DMT)-like permease
MLLLLLASLLWAFSFGLIKRLSGLDGAFISAVRLGLALLVFLPFLRLPRIAARHGWPLAGIGAVQFGLMYLAYNESFRFLQAHEVAVFTLSTPIFVTLVADGLERTLRLRALLAAALAVLGGALVVVKGVPSAATWTGVALVQLSNLAFALGQVLYRRFQPRLPGVRERDVFALLYAGGFAVTLPVMLLRTNFTALPLTSTHLWILLYLGIVASGVGFFLWNRGATQVTPGVLAAMNNTKIPLAVAVSLLVFGERTHLPSLVASLAVMAAAVWLAAERRRFGK